MKFRQTTFFGAAMGLNIVLSFSAAHVQAAVSCDSVFSPITQAKIEDTLTGRRFGRTNS